MPQNYFPADFTDQLQNKIHLSQPPRRIVSLVPSQTELLFELGLEKKIVGVTKFCVHPQQKVKLKTKIGGTKNFHFDIIRSLQPDLIIGNKEENYLDGIQELQQHYPVWVSDIGTLRDALAMIESIGTITHTSGEAEKIIRKIKEGFASLKPYPHLTAAYLIWRKPYMSVGKDTFIHEIMRAAGLVNVFSHLNRYPEITPNCLEIAKPALILLSSEPYPFQEKHIREMKEICPAAVVKVVDGELFSWYGSRLKLTPPYLKRFREELATALPY